jgi:hypothetical protein
MSNKDFKFRKKVFGQWVFYNYRTDFDPLGYVNGEPINIVPETVNNNKSNEGDKE